jgi:hypothetical protein
MSDDNEITNPEERSEAAKPASNLPLIITLIALLVYFSFQTLSLLSERSNLGFVKSNQDGALQEAQKVQAQFKLLVTKTSDLANQGHAGAKMVMEGLERQGVGFAADSSTPTKPETKAAK